MARLKAFLVNLATVAVTIGLMLIMAEVVLRFLPVATALPVEPPTDAKSDPALCRQSALHLVVRLEHASRQSWSLERARLSRRLRLRCRHPRPLVAVVGDSYIEALLVPFAESLTGGCRARSAIADAPMCSRSRVRR